MKVREFSPEIAEQLREQLDRAAAGRPARTPSEGAKSSVATAREAVMEAMFLVAAVDGKVTELEIAQFAGGIDDVFGTTGDEDIEAHVKLLAARLASEGWDKRMASVTAALAGTDLAETAYRLAGAVAFVDDRIEHAEAAALDALAGALGISDERSQALLDRVRADLFG